MFRPGGKKPERSGRKPGTPNKATNEFRELLEAQGLDPATELTQMLSELDPPKRADILVKMLEYIYPKRKAVEGVIEFQARLAPQHQTREQAIDSVMRIREERGLNVDRRSPETIAEAKAHARKQPWYDPTLEGLSPREKAERLYDMSVAPDPKGCDQQDDSDVS